MSQGFGIGQIIDGHHLQVRVAVQNTPESRPPDPSKTVDRNFNHGYSSMFNNFIILARSKPTMNSPSISTTGTPIWPEPFTISSLAEASLDTSTSSNSIW